MKTLTLIPLALLTAIGCGDDHANVTLAVAVPQSSALAAAGGNGLTLERSGDTLNITSAEVVLREIEVEQVEGTGKCQGDDDGGDSDDDCEFETGPMIMELPLDGTVSQIIDTAVPAGTYDEIEFDVHKLDSDNSQPLLDERPDFLDQSVLVRGTFNGAAFEYKNDLNEEQEIELARPMEVSGDRPIGLTLSIDISTWFVDGSGDLIDPSTANHNGSNENIVEDNIKNSIDAFEDDDHDGQPHHDDDDED